MRIQTWTPVDSKTKFSVNDLGSVCIVLDNSASLSLIFLLFLLSLGKSMPKSWKYCETQRMFNLYLLYRLKCGKLMKDTISGLISEIYIKRRSRLWKRIYWQYVKILWTLNSCFLLPMLPDCLAWTGTGQLHSVSVTVEFWWTTFPCSQPSTLEQSIFQHFSCHDLWVPHLDHLHYLPSTTYYRSFSHGIPKWIHLCA